ncbi:MAG: DUF1684 domain-containing protein [Acidobacteria bacterium]|nr:DUF1684 domain-containing protein [Acidobacteriota bacterium]
MLAAIVVLVSAAIMPVTGGFGQHGDEVSCPASAVATAHDDYEAQVERRRAAYEASLRSLDGYLAVVGLFFLEDGPNVFGADAAGRVVLPDGSAPGRVGVFDFQDGRVFYRIERPGLALLNGRATLSGELRPLGPGVPTPDRLSIGRLSLSVHRSGPRVAIRVRDPQSPFLRDYRGSRWYPIDRAWRIDARFVAHATPRRLEIPNVLGDVQVFESPGYAEFDVGAERLRLEAASYEPDGRVWFVFRDRTTGQTTYPAARFLYADPPRDGGIVLDFNDARNPPCAFNPFTTCPNPPPGNVLPVAIEAGELADLEGR